MGIPICCIRIDVAGCGVHIECQTVHCGDKQSNGADNSGACYARKYYQHRLPKVRIPDGMPFQVGTPDEEGLHRYEDRQGYDE